MSREPRIDDYIGLCRGRGSVLGLAGKRIATAIEWLGEGKKRHWKYERC